MIGLGIIWVVGSVAIGFLAWCVFRAAGLADDWGGRG